MDGFAGLRLLAFRDRSELRWHQFVRSCHFIYPDEAAVKGSRNIFTALLVKFFFYRFIIFFSMFYSSSLAFFFSGIIKPYAIAADLEEEVLITPMLQNIVLASGLFHP